MNTIRAAALAVALLLITTAESVAHHSVWAEFDNGRRLELRGRFLEMDWINPHSWVHFEVTMDDGSTVSWMSRGQCSAASPAQEYSVTAIVDRAAGRRLGVARHVRIGHCRTI